MFFGLFRGTRKYPVIPLVGGGHLVIFVAELGCLAVAERFFLPSLPHGEGIHQRAALDGHGVFVPAARGHFHRQAQHEPVAVAPLPVEDGHAPAAGIPDHRPVQADLGIAAPGGNAQVEREFAGFLPDIRIVKRISSSMG